jgi:hypothetical protein
VAELKEELDIEHVYDDKYRANEKAVRGLGEPEEPDYILAVPDINTGVYRDELVENLEKISFQFSRYYADHARGVDRARGMAALAYERILNMDPKKLPSTDEELDKLFARTLAEVSRDLKDIKYIEDNKEDTSFDNPENRTDLFAGVLKWQSKFANESDLLQGATEYYTKVYRNNAKYHGTMGDIIGELEDAIALPYYAYAERLADRITDDISPQDRADIMATINEALELAESKRMDIHIKYMSIVDDLGGKPDDAKMVWGMKELSSTAPEGTPDDTIAINIRRFNNVYAGKVLEMIKGKVTDRQMNYVKHLMGRVDRGGDLRAEEALAKIFDAVFKNLNGAVLRYPVNQEYRAEPFRLKFYDSSKLQGLAVTKDKYTELNLDNDGDALYMDLLHPGVNMHRTINTKLLKDALETFIAPLSKAEVAKREKEEKARNSKKSWKGDGTLPQTRNRIYIGLALASERMDDFEKRYGGKKVFDRFKEFVDRNSTETATVATWKPYTRKDTGEEVLPIESTATVDYHAHPEWGITETNVFRDTAAKRLWWGLRDAVHRNTAFKSTFAEPFTEIVFERGKSKGIERKEIVRTHDTSMLNSIDAAIDERIRGYESDEDVPIFASSAAGTTEKTPGTNVTDLIGMRMPEIISKVATYLSELPAAYDLETGKFDLAPEIQDIRDKLLGIDPNLPDSKNPIITAIWYVDNGITDITYDDITDLIIDSLRSQGLKIVDNARVQPVEGPAGLVIDLLLNGNRDKILNLVKKIAPDISTMARSIVSMGTGQMELDPTVSRRKKYRADVNTPGDRFMHLGFAQLTGLARAGERLLGDGIAEILGDNISSGLIGEHKLKAKRNIDSLNGKGKAPFGRNYGVKVSGGIDYDKAAEAGDGVIRITETTLLNDIYKYRYTDRGTVNLSDAITTVSTIIENAGKKYKKARTVFDEDGNVVSAPELQFILHVEKPISQTEGANSKVGLARQKANNKVINMFISAMSNKNDVTFLKGKTYNPYGSYMIKGEYVTRDPLDRDTRVIVPPEYSDRTTEELTERVSEFVNNGSRDRRGFVDPFSLPGNYRILNSPGGDFYLTDKLKLSPNEEFTLEDAINLDKLDQAPDWKISEEKYMGRVRVDNNDNDSYHGVNESSILRSIRNGVNRVGARILRGGGLIINSLGGARDNIFTRGFFASLFGKKFNTRIDDDSPQLSSDPPNAPRSQV